MPLPLIPILIGAAAVALVSALAVPRILDALNGQSIAVLGGRSVGKTTLLYLLLHKKLPGASDDAPEIALGGEFEIRAGRKSSTFTVRKDIPEHPGDGGYQIWKDTFSSVDHVWYLFRADLIAHGDPAEVAKVKSHLDLFSTWLGNKNLGNPKITLIGTWADGDSDYVRDPKAFRETLATSSPIKLGMVKLGHPALIVGSMNGKKESDRLLQKIGKTLHGK